MACHCYGVQLVSKGETRRGKIKNMTLRRTSRLLAAILSKVFGPRPRQSALFLTARGISIPPSAGSVGIWVHDLL